MISRTPDSGRDSLKALSPRQRLRVGELIDEYELAQDEGSSVTPEQLCANEPELLEALISSIRKLAATDQRLCMLGTTSFPQKLGDFQTLKQIGVGGSGVVLRCQQQDPDRQIAVKILKPTIDAQEQRKRFRRELSVFSALKVPGIAEVYVTGVTEWNGVECFWIAMELLDGGHINDYVTTNALSQRAIVKLFRDICLTMQAAHRTGIIHRDLKPSNILVSAAGVPHVVDFGIAAIIRSDNSAKTETASEVMGTAAWMAPEIVLGTPQKADTRSDIFSLGAVLFQLFTGRHPYETEGLTIPQVVQRFSAGPSLKLSTLTTGVSRDLDTFVSRMTDRDPAYRYQNLDDVVADLDRILVGDPISMRAVSLSERAWRWCRKNVLLSSIAAVAAVAVLTAMIVFLFSARSIRMYAEQLEHSNKELQQRTADLEDAFRLRERAVVNARLGSLAERLHDNPRETEQKLGDPALFPPAMRSFGWELLRFQSRTDFRRLHCADTPIRSIQFSHNGKLLASKSVAGMLQMTDIESGDCIWQTDGVLKRSHSPLKFSPDDRFIYCIGEKSGIRKYDADSGRLLETLLADTVCRNSLLDLSEDGRWLVAVSEDNRLMLVDVNSGKVRERELGTDVSMAAVWLQNEGQIISGITGNGVRKVWFVPSLIHHLDEDMKTLHWGFGDIKSGTASLRMADGGAHAVISGNADVLVARWDAAPKPVVQQYAMDDEQIDAVSLMPPFSALVTAGDCSRVFNLYSGKNRIFRDDGRTPISNAVSTTGQHIAIGDTQGGVGIYRVNIPSRRHTVIEPPHNWPMHDYGPPVSTVSTRDCRHAFVGHDSGVLVKIDLGTQRPISVTRVSSRRISSLVISPSEDWIACGANGTEEENGIYVFECGSETTEASSEERPALRQLAKLSTPRVCSVALSEDGQSLLAAHRNGQVSVIDIASWTITKQWQAHMDPIFALAIGPGIVVSADTRGLVKVWHPDNLEAQQEWPAHDRRISGIAIDPAGERIFTTSHDRTAAIWTRHGRLVRRLTGHAAAVRAVAVSPDGQTLATAGEDYLIHLWDAQTGDAQFVLQGHTRTVRSLQFMRLGLLSTSHDFTMSLWGAPVDQATE